MSTPYTPAVVFPASFVVPDDGDPKNASSVNIALEAIGDRTQYLYRKGGRGAFDYAAIRAIAAPADGDRVYTIFGGDYVFSILGGGPEDVPFKLLPTDGTTGAWFQSASLGVVMTNDGLPRMTGTKIRPVYITNASIYEDALYNVPPSADQVTTSTTYVDVTGASLTFAAVAGDRIFVEAHALMKADVTSGTSVALASTIVDPSAGTVVTDLPWIAANVAGDFVMRSHKFKYPAVGTGTYTVKSQLKSTAGGAVRVQQGSVSLSVRVVRP